MLLVITGCFAEAAVKEEYKVINDSLEESKITVLVPDKLSGKVLLYAHGLRYKDAPLTSAVSERSKLNQALLKEGWIIASTSYRRNGVIIFDAIQDIEKLRKHIEAEYGKADEIYIIGTSMGGKIITLIAEQENPTYTAVMGIGAALHLTEKGKPDDLTFKPQIPILFLSNQSETDSPENYLSKYKPGKVKPVLWIVDRDGHVNTNSEEELLAFNALLEFAQGNEIESNKHILFDASERESVARFEEEKAFAKVLSVHPSYGNMNTEFCKADLIESGINKNSYFEVGFKDKVYKILWGSTYSDVNYGMWVAFLNSEGFLKIARNYKNAANLLKCTKGDEIFIQKRIQTETISNAKADSLGGMAWYKLLKNKPEEAEEFAKQALELTPNKKWILMNLAHSYLLSNRFDEAKEIYEANKGSRIMDGSFYFEDMVIEDIEEMKKESIENIYFDKIIELMK